MKKKIHPKYYHDAQVVCTCGNKFVTGSIKKTIQVEICSACHPFFTGEMKYIDTLGRVERFKKKQAAAQKKSKKSKKSKKQDKNSSQSPKSLKEMLEQAKKNTQVKS